MHHTSCDQECRDDDEDNDNNGNDDDVTSMRAIRERENSANRRRNERRNDVRCGGGVSGDATIALTSQGKGAMGPNLNRQDEGDATMTSQEKLKRRGEVATRGRMSMIDAGGAKEGCDGDTTTII